MKRIIVLLSILAVVMLSGCATRIKQGDYTGDPTLKANLLAEDACKGMVAVYPPASTKLSLKSEVRDDFGAALVEKLRASGFAVLEPTSAVRRKAEEIMTPEVEQGLLFSYVLDNVPEEQLMRLTLFVGESSLSRAYRSMAGGSVAPAGAWVRKE